MIIPKTFIFFAVSCIAAASTVSAADEVFTASSVQEVLHQGSGNYIIQLKQATCIKHCMLKQNNNYKISKLYLINA